MSRVEDCRLHVVISSSRDKIERRILCGTYYSSHIKYMPTKRLENILNNLIKLTTESGDEENIRRPSWWPHDIFFSTVDAMKKEALGASLDWTKILQHAVFSCMEHYRKQPVKTSTQYPLRAKRKLTDKNTNLVDFMCKKPRMEEPFGDILNRIAVRNNVINGMRPKTRQDMWPVVKLKDILRKPVRKTDFMNFLQLAPVKASGNDDTKSSDKIKTRKYSYTIPFSSDLGRILMRREKYTLSSQVYQRKEERVQYHLKDQPVIIQKTYDIAYNNNNANMHEHNYRFPKRQHRQGQNYLKRLENALCKPLSVRMQRHDISDYVGRNSLHKTVRVNIKRLDIGQFMKSDASYLVPNSITNSTTQIHIV